MKNKRLASKISPDELFNLYEKKINIKYKEEKYLSFDNIVDVDKIYDDISKINFNFENMFYKSSDNYKHENILGPLSVGDLSFIGCKAGGDWEYPVYFIIYLDKNGKTLRGYVPKSGNSYNIENKIALGNDENIDLKFLKKWLKTNKNLTEEELGSVLYDDGDLMFDFDLILKDISERIKVAD